jgi:four helix bundle protein
MPEMNADDVSDRLLEFAVRVGKVVDSLPDTRLGRHIAGQLVRCGTSPPPNYEEARAAESRADFVHKLSICLKELREVRSWVRLVVKAEILPHARMADLSEECTELCKIVAQSIVTAKGGKGRPAKRNSTPQTPERRSSI